MQHGAWNTAANRPPEALPFKDLPTIGTWDKRQATGNVSQLSMSMLDKTLKAACDMVERGNGAANFNIKTEMLTLAITFTPVSKHHASDAGNAGNAGNASDVGDENAKGNANHAGVEGDENAGGNACDEGDADNISHIGDAWFKQNCSLRSQPPRGRAEA